MKVYNTKNVKARKLSFITNFQASYGVLSDKCILAGGSLRKMIDSSDVIQDYDLFFLSEDAIEQTRGKLLSLGFEVAFECSEMTTLRLGSEKIQLIKLVIYDSVENILESFDFTACMAATDGVSIWFTTSLKSPGAGGIRPAALGSEAKRNGDGRAREYISQTAHVPFRIVDVLSANLW